MLVMLPGIVTLMILVDENVPPSHAGDRITIGRSGNDHHIVETGIFYKSDRVIVIGRKCELGLNDGGQRKQQYRTEEAGLNQDASGFHNGMNGV
jgi:hypothetical protein